MNLNQILSRPPTAPAPVTTGAEATQLAPRRFTAREIEECLAMVPEVRSSNRSTSRANTESLRESFREQLLYAPEIHPLAIQEFMEAIKLYAERTRISPGSSVGISASEAQGQINMQSSLNSFHTTGTTKAITSGADRFMELVNVTMNPKTRSCTLHFV